MNEFQLDYIQARRFVVNQMFTLTSMLTHNLGRELQMSAEPRSLHDSANRATR